MDEVTTLTDEQKVISYFEKIARERDLFSKYTLIQTGKTPSENFNCNILPKLSEKATEYGFTVKLLHMISSLDITNENIILVNDIWTMLRANSSQTIVFNTYYWTKLNQLCAYIVYDIRHFIDQIIAMTWILNQSEPVTKVKVDCIGEYLYDSEFSLFDKYLSFLQQLNDISNAYKHSLSNDMTSLIGRDEPCIFALDGNHNKNIFKPKLYGISLKDLVASFNSFYKDAFRILEGH